jgi:lanosterol synthase
MEPSLAFVCEAIDSSLHRLAGLQGGLGEWEGEVIWSPLIAAQYVIARSCVGKNVPAGERDAFLTYFAQQQTDEGGWGLHPESRSNLFVTTLVYVAQRMLGAPKHDRLLAAARDLIRKLGTPLAIPTWGKLWLAFCNLYDFSGIFPILPELWLLPAWLPFHPSRFYCHTRQIYLGMSYLWGRRFRCPVDDMCLSLREELYGVPYESIDFKRGRGLVSRRDCRSAPSASLKAANAIFSIAEKCIPAALRRRACERTLSLIEFEQRSTEFAALSPVNGLLNVLSLYAANSNHTQLAPSLDGLAHWLWCDDANGARLCGARSQVWDTALVVEAAHHAANKAAFGPNLAAAAAYLRVNQVKTELDDGAKYFRSPRLGGWCFSDARHGWPVSDTTAEALCAELDLRESGMEMVAPENLDAAVRFLLARQNRDGGWGSYERRRGSLLLERMNPSEMFGQCMVEHSYVECTGSALCALARFGAAFPDHCMTKAIASAIRRGQRYVIRVQDRCGAWSGFWGVNYTYGTMFAVRGLVESGVSPSLPAIRKACDWLVSHQKADGGWGEHWTGMVEKRYVEHPRSQAVQTAWALMSLLLAKDPRREVADRGAAVLVDRQRGGGWPREAVAGVFFSTAMLHYDLYREYFPLWALGLYREARQEKENC